MFEYTKPTYLHGAEPADCMNGIAEMMNGHRNRDYRIGTGYTFSAGGGNFMHRPGADGGGIDRRHLGKGWC